MEINFDKNLTLNQLNEIGYSISFNKNRDFYMIKGENDTYLYTTIYDIKKDDSDFNLPIVYFEYKSQCGDSQSAINMVRDIALHFNSTFLLEDDEEEYVYSCRDLLNKLTNHSMNELGLFLTKNGTICRDKEELERKQQEEDEDMTNKLKDNQKTGDDDLPF